MEGKQKVSKSSNRAFPIAVKFREYCWNRVLTIQEENMLWATLQGYRVLFFQLRKRNGSTCLFTVAKNLPMWMKGTDASRTAPLLSLMSLFI